MSVLSAIVVAMALTGGGCGRSETDYIPAIDDARAALEAALAAWQSGAARGAPIEPPGKSGMVVSLFDRDFIGGRKLQQWKFESAEPEGSGPRQFKVTLTVEGDPQPGVVTYYVTGVAKKYSVFRDVDYEQRATQM